MINIRFGDRKFKIYANQNIKCLGECDEAALNQLKRLVGLIMLSYNSHSDGFPISFLANRLKEYQIDVLNYRDYEKENAKPGTIY